MKAVLKRIAAGLLVIAVFLFLPLLPGEDKARASDLVEVQFKLSGAFEVALWPMGGEIWAEGLLPGFNEAPLAEVIVVRSNVPWGVAVTGKLKEAREPAADNEEESQLEFVHLLHTESGQKLQNPLLIKGGDEIWKAIPFYESVLVYDHLPPVPNGREIYFYFGQEIVPQDMAGSYRAEIIYTIELFY